MNKLPSLHFTSSSFSPSTKSSSSLSPYKPFLTAKQKLSQINFYSKFIKNKKKPNKKPKDTTSQQCNVFFFYNSKRTYIFLPNSKINIDEGLSVKSLRMDFIVEKDLTFFFFLFDITGYRTF